MAAPIHTAGALLRALKRMAMAGTVTMKAMSTALAAHPHFLRWSSIFTSAAAAPSRPVSMSSCGHCLPGVLD